MYDLADTRRERLLSAGLEQTEGMVLVIMIGRAAPRGFDWWSYRPSTSRMPHDRPCPTHCGAKHRNVGSLREAATDPLTGSEARTRDAAQLGGVVTLRSAVDCDALSRLL